MTGVNLVDPPSSMNYASVVISDSESLASLIYALNNLYFLAGDIQDAYLKYPTKEKVFFCAGNEWKFYQGKVVVIVRALYGFKSSALEWRNHLSKIIGNHLVLQSSLADPDYRFKAATDKTGNEYYTYILVYVDNLPIVEKYPLKYMAMLESKYTVKLSSIGYPKVYIGADVGKLLYGDGSYVWRMKSDSYVK